MADRQARNAERTRRDIIEAATRVLSRLGPTASLAAIAQDAATSKGGLLHHFPTRDELIVAVFQWQIAQFDARVDAALDSSDVTAGRLTRAFVDAVFADIAEQHGRAHEQALLWGAVGAHPQVRELLAADTRRWDDLLAADGLDPQRVMLIVRAADGASMAAVYGGGFSAEDAARTRTWLHALTRGDGPVR